METLYDWLSVAVFSGLIVLFLQRSSVEEPQDKMYQYFPAAIGCAVANYLGNNDQAVLAWLTFVAIGVYVWYVLKPLAH